MTRRISAGILTALVVLSVLSVSLAAAVEVQTTDDFEDGNAGEWYADGPGGSTAATFGAESTQPQEGTYHLNASTPDKVTDHVVTDQFDVSAGEWNMTTYVNVTNGSNAALVVFSGDYENATAFEIRRSVGSNSLEIRDRDPFDSRDDWNTFSGPVSIGSEPFASGYYRLDVDRFDGELYYTVTGATGSVSGVVDDGTDAFNFSYERLGVYTADGDYAYFDNFTMANEYEPPTLNGSTAAPRASTDDTVTFEIDVTDPDLPGDEVTGTLYLDGVESGSDTVTSNGTLSVSAANPGTEVNVTWVAEDSHGLTDTYEYELNTPGTLTVYDESDPNTTLAGTNVTGTFFIEDANGTVITRETSTGVFSLNVSNATVPVTVQLSAENYTTRTYRLPDLSTDRSAFLLPTSEPRASVRFVLDDNSGSFSPSSAVTLYVERALNQSGTAEYRVVASDQFDATNSVVVELRDETRHRLRLVNADGETRVPGSYTTRGSATEVIVIGQLTILVPDEDASAFDALLEPDTGPNGVIRTAYRDTDNLTHTVDVTIYEQGSPFNTIVTNDTATGDGPIISTYAVPAGSDEDQTWVVEWKVTQDGTVTSSGREIVGGAADLGGRFNLDPDVQEMVGYVVLVGAVGLAVIIDARRLAPVVATAFASGLTAIGVLTFPLPLLGFAGVATVLLVMSGGDR